MPTPPTDQSTKPSPTRARIGLVLLTLLSVGPPICHYLAVVPTIDSARMNGGLLPGPLVFLRLFGPASAFLSLIILGALISSFVGRRFAAPLLSCCGALFLVFSVAYLCYVLFAIAFVFATSAV